MKVYTIQDLLLPWILLINIPFLLTKSAGLLLAFKIDQVHSLVKAFACVTLSTQKALSLTLERPFVKNPSEWCPGHFLIHCPTSIFFKDCAQPVFEKNLLANFLVPVHLLKFQNLFLFISHTRSSLVAQSVKSLPAMQETWVRIIPWRRKEQPTPVFLPGNSHG